MMQINRQKMCVLLFLSCLFVCFVLGSSISAFANETISLQIIGDDESGVILEEKQVSFVKDDTPLSVLLRHGKNVIVRGGNSQGYVEEIAKLTEGLHGPRSGWVYVVNEKAPEESAGSHKLQSGDKVVWQYVYGE